MICDEVMKSQAQVRQAKVLRKGECPPPARRPPYNYRIARFTNVQRNDLIFVMTLYIYVYPKSYYVT